MKKGLIITLCLLMLSGSFSAVSAKETSIDDSKNTITTVLEDGTVYRESKRIRNGEVYCIYELISDSNHLYYDESTNQVIDLVSGRKIINQLMVEQ